jgi:hypothetical protein
MYPSSPMARKFKVQLAAGKFMLMLFWDLRGPILEHCQERGRTVNSECYCALLTNELKPAICTRQRGQLLQSIILQQKNISALTDHKIFKTIQNFKFELLEHSPYSLDHAPTNL